MHNIYQCVGDYNWTLYNWASLSKNCWKHDEGVYRYQLGTIVLRPCGFSYSFYVQHFVTTYATLFELEKNHNHHKIPPDQYLFINKPTHIRKFASIYIKVHKVMLQQLLSKSFQYNGEPVSYRNVTAIDLSDDTDLEVNIVWWSSEMKLFNFFEPYANNRLPHVMNIDLTFAAYLFGQFFSNVTCINLSAIVWSNNASSSINWARVEKLIWQKCLRTSNIFLSDLRTSKNLIELQSDNFTFRVPKLVQSLYHLISAAHPHTIFHNLNTCNKF